MKLHVNYILLACVLILATLCFLSVYSPVRFDEQRQQRELVVKERLVRIRQAEELYRRQHGIYTGDFAELIKSGLLADSLTVIPYSDNERFELAASMETTRSGRQIPLMECGAQYKQYLNGLDENTVGNLMDEASQTGAYPGLRIGDITHSNNNAGNWER